MKSLLRPFTIPAGPMRSIRRVLPKFEPVILRSPNIPVSEPVLQGNELRYVEDAIKTSWISARGSYVERFESAFAKHISHTTYAVAVNSGTSALHLSLVAANIGPGDEVVMPSFTMIATANAVRYTGAKPVFVDADPATWNLDTTKLERVITKRTKAILPVHIYGLPADMRPILILAKKYGLWVIEDAAEAHGAEYRGKRVGSLGDIAAFSLFANKVVTTGEGGMITTNNTKLADLVRTLRGHAFTPSHHFWHQFIGYSYEMSNLQAAVGLAQTERFHELVSTRRAHAALYTKLLYDVPGLTLPVEPKGYRSVFWMYGVLVDQSQFGIDRDMLRKNLADRGIETRTFFIPIHLQPPYFSGHRNRYPVAERLASEGLYLPSSAALTERDIRSVVRAIIDARK